MIQASPLPDGLYRVEHGPICAGFVVEAGRVVACAPVLRRRLSFWASIAERIGA
jgi:hypothetical protein